MSKSSRLPQWVEQAAFLRKERPGPSSELGSVALLMKSVFDGSINAIILSQNIYNGKGIIIDLEIMFCNHAAIRMIGEDPTGKKCSDLFVASITENFFENCKQVAQTGISNNLESVLHLNNKQIWVHAQLSPIEDGLLATIEDITEKVKADKEKKDSAHFISQIIETTPDIISITDLDTRLVVYASRQVAADLGYTKGQVLKMKNPKFDLLHPDDIAPMIAHFKKLKELTSDDAVLEIEYRLKNAEGGYHTYCDRDSVFKRNSRKIPVEKIGISQDITSRKKQEEQMLTSLDILAQAEQITNMGSWEYNISSEEFKWSEGMYRLFNLKDRGKVTPEIYFEYTGEEERDRINTIVNNITMNFKPFEDVITLYPENGEKKIIRIKAVLVKDKKKQPLKMIGVDLDITEHIKLAMEINDLSHVLVARNNEMKNINSELKVLSQVIALDFKQNFQTLYTNLEYIASRESRSFSDTSKANIRRAQAVVQRMKLLADDISLYLQLYDVAIEKEHIDVNRVIEGILEERKGKFQQLDAKVDLMQIESFPADATLIRPLIAHLLDNSLKFRKPDVTPHIQIKFSKADELNGHPQAEKDMSYAILSISDNGMGFEEMYADKIFELFFRINMTDNHKGSGIGLAICKKIMNMHGGFMTTESVPANGSSFHCFFPARIGSL